MLSNTQATILASILLSVVYIVSKQYILNVKVLNTQSQSILVYNYIDLHYETSSVKCTTARY